MKPLLAVLAMSLSMMGAAGDNAAASVPGDYDTDAEAALGAALGDYLQTSLNLSLTDMERRRHDISASWALWYNDTGDPEIWIDPATGASGGITPMSKPTLAYGSAICRFFEEWILIPGFSRRSVEGRVCLAVDHWFVEPAEALDGTERVDPRSRTAEPLTGRGPA